MPDSTARLRHVVLLGFTDDTGPEVIDEVVRRFCALADAIAAIDGFEWGVNASTEGLDHGHSHCFTLTFRSEAARDSYLPHPDHVAFAEFARPHLKTVTVVDYWTRDVRA